MNFICLLCRNCGSKWNLLSILLMLVLSCFTIGTATAQSGAANTKLVSGSVQTSEGTPVAGADVWLVFGLWEAPKVLAKVKSNSEGRFEFDISEHQESPGVNYFDASVVAQHKNHGLGWFFSLGPDRRRDIPVKLQATTEFQGQLVDAADQPIANATIYPTNLWRGSVGNVGQKHTRIPKDFAPRWQVQTDEKGVFSIPGFLAAGVAGLSIEHTTIKNLNVRLNLGQKAMIKIDASVEASGKIELPAGFDRTGIDEKNIGTVTLYTSSTHDQDGEMTTDIGRISMWYGSQSSAPIESDFSFRFNKVFAGSCSLRVKFSDSVPLIPPDLITQKIGGEAPPLVIKALAGFRVSGKVVARNTDVPVAGVMMRISSSADGRLQPIAHPLTDTQGNYSAIVSPGKLRISAVKTPSEFVPSPKDYGRDLEPSPILKLDVARHTVLPDFELDSASDVEIKVTNENGEPVAGAIVKVVTVAGYPDGGYRQPVQKTDADGRYVIRQVAVNDTLPIWVRTPTAISELVVTPEELDGPLEISLSNEGARFRVRITDDDDEPIAGASVSLSTSFRYQSKWMGRMGMAKVGSAGSGKTDDEGVFVSGPLWTGKRQQYRLKVSAEGYLEGETPRMLGKEGEVVDAGQLVLLRARSTTVQGTVINSAGDLVAGANVFCSGDQHRQARTSTESNGQFTLDHVANDLKYVFVTHPDYRFGGGKVSGSEALEIKLQSKDDPPAGIRKWKPLDSERQREAAQELILKALELPIGARNTSRRELLCSLDRIDSQLADKRSAENENGLFNRSIRTARARRMEIRDSDNVIPILQTVRQRTAFSIARRFCSRLSWSDDETDHEIADKYLKFADDIAGTRNSNQIQLALLYSQRGKTEKSKSLIDAIFKRIEDQNIAVDRYPAGMLAEALAPIDFDKAMKFTEKLKEGYTRTDAQANVALAILKQDPEKSLALISQLKGDGNAQNIRDKTRLRAALMLVDKDPETAIDLVYQCEDAGNRSQALGRLAVRVSEFDRPKSWKMIEDAIGIYKLPNQQRSWSNYGGAGPFAAAIAHQAKLVEYPDMKSVIWHVLNACRGGSEKRQDRLDSTISTARILALTDKISARELLRSIASQKDQIPRETYSVSLYDRYLQAWTLVDFGRGTALIREDLERIEKAGAAEHFRTGLRDVFQLLVAPPEERFHLLFEETGLWRLEEDGTQE